MCVCVCPCLRALIANGLIWCDIDPVQLVDLHITLPVDKVDGCSLSNTVHCGSELSACLE